MSVVVHEPRGGIGMAAPAGARYLFERRTQRNVRGVLGRSDRVATVTGRTQIAESVIGVPGAPVAQD
jgi:hypothetical protein